MKDFYAKCGCNCGHCPAYKANAKTKKDRQRCSDGWAKYLGAELRPDRCFCLGCQSANPWKTGNLLPDRSCNIRPCVIKTRVKMCAYCSAYPCKALRQRIPGEDFRKKIESRIGAPISEKDYLTFIKPYEGLKHLAEIRASLDKKKIVEKLKVTPVKPRIAAFPKNLPYSKKEISAFKALYDLIANIHSVRANTYAQQLILKRRTRHLINILWIFGLYGKLKKDNGSHLIIDSATYGSQAEISFLVRKRDNSLHEMFAQCFKILKNYGVNAKHLRLSKKNWLLKLSFNKKAGGVAALRSLKHRATKLAKKYGEPVYAGSSRLKGKAYMLFSKADMRALMKKSN